MSYTAATLAYVRTPDGVVKVAEGESVPTDALPDDLTRLTKTGAIVESAPVVPAPEAAPAKPSTHRTKPVKPSED